MNRRTLLHGLAAAGTTGLMGAVAGCTSGGDGNGGNGGNGDSDGGGTTTGGDGGGTTTGGGATTSSTTTGSGTTTGGTATTSGQVTTGGTTRFSATINVLADDKWGDILVGPNGLSLYLFTEDKPGKSVCYGDCAEAWPPLLVEGEPTVGEGVTADIGTITRKDGSKQVTVDGNPVYFYTPDKQPGDTKGQGLGGVWFLIAPDGSKITGAGTETTTGTGDSGGSTGGGGINY